jgi:hypothetical protein
MVLSKKKENLICYKNTFWRCECYNLGKIWIMYNAIFMESVTLQKFNYDNENSTRKKIVLMLKCLRPYETRKSNENISRNSRVTISTSAGQALKVSPVY